MFICSVYGCSQKAPLGSKMSDAIYQKVGDFSYYLDVGNMLPLRIVAFQSHWLTRKVGSHWEEVERNICGRQWPINFPTCVERIARK